LGSKQCCFPPPPPPPTFHPSTLLNLSFFTKCSCKLSFSFLFFAFYTNIKRQLRLHEQGFKYLKTYYSAIIFLSVLFMVSALLAELGGGGGWEGRGGVWSPVQARGQSSLKSGTIHSLTSVSGGHYLLTGNTGTIPNRCVPCIPALFPSLYFPTLHFPSLYFPSLYVPSLNFPSLYFPSLYFASLHFPFPYLSCTLRSCVLPSPSLLSFSE
jgi:hypothetical protein